MKTLLAIRHVPFEDLGSFEQPLAEAGYIIRYLAAPTADFGAFEQEPPDLLVILGGPISVNDAKDYPFLSAELKFIEARLKSGAPTLGICLGSQLMAKALGAEIHRGKRMEIGWKPLTLTQAGKHSPLRHLTAPVLHWHGDVFELPAGAENLASTDITSNQGYTWGKSALAVQFHPEVTARGLEQWYVGNTGELKEQGLTPGALRRDAAAHAATLEKQGGAFLSEWLNSL
ncbi:MAG TPA: glutamine amidotransferase [Gammaproteobacteria bacterium]|nr:glutamine amidotransferase [Gammaproteobacteria bacterium]